MLNLLITAQFWMYLQECDCILNFGLTHNGHLAVELVDYQFTKILVPKMEN